MLFERDFEVDFEEVFVAVRGSFVRKRMIDVYKSVRRRQTEKRGRPYSDMPTSRANSINSPLRCFCSQYVTPDMIAEVTRLQ